MVLNGNINDKCNNINVRYVNLNSAAVRNSMISLRKKGLCENTYISNAGS